MEHKQKDNLPAIIDTDLPEPKREEPSQGIVPKIEPYQGIATLEFTEEQKKVLAKEIKDDDVELRPDGLIYYPEIRYRKLLNEVFGPGKWAIQPRGIEIHENIMCYKGALYINGKFVAETIGEQEYFPTNPKMSYATAAEAAKSNCLVRCCKDLGIAWNLWDPVFVKKWLDKYAVSVWCINQETGKKRKLWRKKTDPPINTWPWVEQDQQSSKSVETQVKTKPASSKTSEKTNGKTTEKEIRQKLGDLILEITEGDVIRARDVLEWVSSFEADNGSVVKGISTLSELKGKRLQATYGKAKKLHEEWKEDKAEFWVKMDVVLDGYRKHIGDNK